MAFLPVLDLADAMFARKFDPAYDEGILDAVDRLRLDEHQAKHRGKDGDEGRFGELSQSQRKQQPQQRSAHEYHPAKQARFGLRPRTKRDPLLCLAFTDRAAALEPCEPLLEGAEGAEAKRWAMGSARGSGQGGGSSRALGRQLLDVGPCSKDGEVKLDEDTGIIVALRGPYSQPYCQIKPSGGRENACLDVEREQVVPGARLIKWACKKTKWNCCASRVVSPEVLLA